MKMKIKLWNPIPKARTRGIGRIILLEKLKGLTRIRRSRKNFQLMNSSLATTWDTHP